MQRDFDFSARATAHWRDEEQAENVRRVGGAIGQAVLRFCSSRLLEGGAFRMAELTEAVGREHAPDSAGRILRLLRREGLIDYALTSRSGSLYRVTRVSRSER